MKHTVRPQRRYIVTARNLLSEHKDSILSQHEIYPQGENTVYCQCTRRYTVTTRNTKPAVSAQRRYTVTAINILSMHKYGILSHQ